MGRTQKYQINVPKTCSVLLLSYRNTSESLGEREMLWEHESIGECFYNFFVSSPQLSQGFLELEKNMQNMFSISFRKFRDERKKTAYLL